MEDKGREDIARGVRSFTVGTALSRVMGLVREMVFAHLFGASQSAAADAFNVAFISRYAKFASLQQ